MTLIIPLLLGIGLFAAVFSGSDIDDADDTPPVEPPLEPPVATNGDDVVTLTALADIFDGGDGNDSIDGAAGFDTLLGGDGEDTIEGGFGKDSIDGGSDNDTLYGGADNDSIDGNQGFDDIYGGSGNDQIQGGFGKDLIDGGDGNDRIDGEEWHDGLFGGAGNDEISGGAGDDVIVGGDGEDRLYGDDGDDFILMGANTLGPIGEDGYDLFDIAEGGAGDDIILGQSGEDLIYGGDGSDLLVGSDILPFELTFEDLVALRNDIAPDVTPINEVLPVAETGNDYDEIYGGNGDDLLILGDFDDASGGAGADGFVIGDWITEGKAAFISDFNSTEDVISVALDSENADAEVTTSQDGDLGQIFIDGVLIATVRGSFDAADGIDADVVTFLYG